MAKTPSIYPVEPFCYMDKATKEQISEICRVYGDPLPPKFARKLFHGLTEDFEKEGTIDKDYILLQEQLLGYPYVHLVIPAHEECRGRCDGPIGYEVQEVILSFLKSLDLDYWVINDGHDNINICLVLDRYQIDALHLEGLKVPGGAIGLTFPDGYDLNFSFSVIDYPLRDKKILDRLHNAERIVAEQDPNVRLHGKPIEPEL